MKRGKKYTAASKLIEAKKEYTIAEASELVKTTSTVKFDATVELSMKLNVDTKANDQQVRGTLVLPHGNGKEKKVLVLTQNKIDEAKAAGADFVGGKETIEKIKNENWFGYDVIVATPDMMGEIGKIGRILGPKGLMPNPKTGTVTMDVTNAIKEIKAGKVEYRVDKDGNMHLSVGRVSFPAKNLEDNLNACVEAVVRARPAVIKGVYIKNAVVHTTMGPAIHVTFAGK
jgi:large subunit ribosomal protein L1